MVMPLSWVEFRKGGTAVRRTGFMDGTWMDPEDARPRRARCLCGGRIGYRVVTLLVRQKPTIECGQVMWPASIKLEGGATRGYVAMGETGYEFYLNP